MYLLKTSKTTLFAMLSAFGLSSVSYADTVRVIEPVKLPTMTVMAEPELRAETGYLPFQEQPKKRTALQQRMVKLERDIQSYTVDADFAGNVDILPPQPASDLGSLLLGLQHYVLAVADGLQSSDPRNGVYTMLQHFGIDHNATNVQISREQFNTRFPPAN